MAGVKNCYIILKFALFTAEQFLTREEWSMGDWFCTKVSMQQRYLLSPTHFNIFLEKIMLNTISANLVLKWGWAYKPQICWCHQRPVDGSEYKLANLVRHLDEEGSRYDREINVEKTKLMWNRNPSGSWSVTSQKLEMLKQFK